MLSTKLVQLIEENWEMIASRLIIAIRRNPDMDRLAQESDLDLRAWCQNMLQHLGELLAVQKEDDLERRFEVVGRLRFEENIPLHEAVLRFHILKEKIIGFVHEQGFPMTAMQLYAEEELELRMGRFFDACVYRIVRGYESALRRAAQLTV